MCWCEHELKPSRNRIQVFLGFPWCMGRMVVKDKSDFVTGRVFSIQHFQEMDEIRAFMGWTDKRYCFPCKQVNCCQQGNRPETDIFIIPPQGAGFPCIRNWRPVFRCISNRLYPWLFIIGQGVDRSSFKRPEISFFIKLQGQLFINDKHIMHFRIKIRISFFTVISYLKRPDFGIVQDFTQGKLWNRCHARVSFFFCSWINKTGKTGRIPQFSRITVIFWFLACLVNDPGYVGVCYLCLVSAPFAVIQSIFDASLVILFNAKPYSWDGNV